MSLTSLRFEVLTSAHDRSSFTCGNSALDSWFATRATQDQRRNIAQVFVAMSRDELVGCYSLSMFTLSLDTLPPLLAKKLPRYEAIPTALIGRLARATKVRGSGLGTLLLADAIKRVLAVRESVAAYAIVVDARTTPARDSTSRSGSLPLPSRPGRLFLLTQTAIAAHTAAK